MLHFLGESRQDRSDGPQRPIRMVARLELGGGELERLATEEPQVLAQMAQRDAGERMALSMEKNVLE